MREERIEDEAEPLDFVGSVHLGDEPETIGREMRRVVSLDDAWASRVTSWEAEVPDDFFLDVDQGLVPEALTEVMRWPNGTAGTVITQGLSSRRARTDGWWHTQRFMAAW